MKLVMPISPKRLLFFFLALLLLAATSIFWYLNKPRLTEQQTPIIYVYKPGATIQRFAYDLVKLKITNHPQLLINLILLEGREGVLQSGAYELIPGISIQQIIDKLTYGDIATFKFTIVDGWSFKQMMKVMDLNPYIAHHLRGLNSEKIAQKLKLGYPNPEGLFLPETYEFHWQDSDESILLRAHQALEVVLNNEWNSRTTGNFYHNAYQALIVASMIEKESDTPSEFTKISGVIYRRLHQNMRLQIDPTVIYGLGDSYQGKLHHSDLKIDSPYNTYRHKGLPPTPISMPSAATIDAALQPDAGDELYFVANGDGSHYFSATLQAHNKAVTKYLLNPTPNDKIDSTH